MKVDTEIYEDILQQVITDWTFFCELWLTVVCAALSTSTCYLETSTLYIFLLLQAAGVCVTVIRCYEVLQILCVNLSSVWFYSSLPIQCVEF